MIRTDTLDALPIVERLLDNLMAIVPPTGRPGSDARTAIGDLKTNAVVFLHDDTLGEPLDEVFSLVQAAGATQAQFASVRAQLELETPKQLGGTLVRDLCVVWCLAMEAKIIASAEYDCRADVDELVKELQEPFNTAEEITADGMDQYGFQTLVALHAAITNHLVVTALPLPRMLTYEFADVLPTLVIAYRLYADASRCDEIRAENEIVHPLFCPPLGKPCPHDQMAKSKQEAEQAVLTVSTRGFSGEFKDWESVEVTTVFGDPFSHFRFTAAEREPLPLKDWDKRQLVPGNAVTVKLAGEQVVNGYIETRQVSYDANRHGVELIGKSRTAWIARSSIESKNSNFDKMTFEQVARKVLAPFGHVPEIVGNLNPRPFEKLQSQPGEFVWDFLERIARVRGILMGSTPKGNFLLIGQHDYPTVQNQLMEGTNILSCQCIITDKDNYNQYEGEGQATGSDQTQGQAASEVYVPPIASVTAKVLGVLDIIAEQPVKDQQEMLERVLFERQWRDSTKIVAHITTQGWLRDGDNLWYPGMHVFVRSPMIPANFILGAQEVIFRQDSKSGTTTEMMLVPPWRLNATNKFDVDPDVPAELGVNAPSPNAVIDQPIIRN